MDGMLSQDEINALLAGMDTSGTPAGDDAPAADAPAGDPPADTSGGGSGEIDESLLSSSERDTVGEVANISMGSSATTLYSLVNQKVNITTPEVELANWSTVINDYERPCVFVQIKYTVGLDGTNILILKEHDVMVITDLMMGGDGTNTEGEIGELQLSAISEAMNQMMGASATSLSTMISRKVDISPPQATVLDMIDDDPSDIAEFLTQTFVKISFKMQIGDLIDSTLMQLYPIDFAKSLKDTVIAATNEKSDDDSSPMPAAAPEPAPASGPAPDMGIANMGMQPDMSAQMNQQMPMQGMPMQQMPMQGMPMQQMPMMQMPMQPMMNIQPAQFQNFAGGSSILPGGENIGIIKDVPLEVTVELGRTAKPISDILDFAPGTIIELDKVAGEPVDVLVNGKFVAKGEVVVIEESFGVRVTEIIQ